MDELIDTEMGLVEVEPIQAQDVARAESWRKLLVQGFGKTAPDCIDDILLDMARHYAMHRAEEREACAKVADNGWVPSYVTGDLSDPSSWEPGSPWDRGAAVTAKVIAEHIRNRTPCTPSPTGVD